MQPDAKHERAWRERSDDYEDTPGFCGSVTNEEVGHQEHDLAPGRYVDAEPQPDDGEPLEKRKTRIAVGGCKQQDKATRLDAETSTILELLGTGSG